MIADSKVHAVEAVAADCCSAVAVDATEPFSTTNQHIESTTQDAEHLR